MTITRRVTAPSSQNTTKRVPTSGAGSSGSSGGGGWGATWGRTWGGTWGFGLSSVAVSAASPSPNNTARVAALVTISTLARVVGSLTRSNTVRVTVSESLQLEGDESGDLLLEDGGQLLLEGDAAMYTNSHTKRVTLQ